MLGLKAGLNVVDNTGAIRAELINVYKVKKNRPKSVGFGTVGDEIRVVIKKTRAPAPTEKLQRLRKGDMARAVIVRCKKSETRPDGTQIRFDDSACVLLNSKSEMLGTRITGPVSLSLKDRVMSAVPGGRWGKVLALAPKVV